MKGSHYRLRLELPAQASRQLAEEDAEARQFPAILSGLSSAIQLIGLTQEPLRSLIKALAA